jgi:hypothetical protein
VGAYVGGEDDQGRIQVWFETDDGARRELERQVSAVHGGLSWGYEGTGPGNTARTVLADITQDRALAEAWHQEFRGEVVATLAVDQPFRLERGFVELWLAGKGVAVAPEWETFPAVDLAAQIGDRPPVTPDRTLEQLSDRAAALDAREAALEGREQELDRRELRVDAGLAAWQAETRVEPRSSLPVEPVRVQIEELVRGTGDDLATVARGMNIEPEWAAGVLGGSIAEVDVDHVQRLCEGLRCTPHDFWGAEDANGIMEAYRPELWPQWIEPLVAPPPDPGGPELSL